MCTKETVESGTPQAAESNRRQNAVTEALYIYFTCYQTVAGSLGVSWRGLAADTHTLARGGFFAS